MNQVLRGVTKEEVGDSLFSADKNGFRENGIHWMAHDAGCG